MADEVWGFDRDRAERLKAIADQNVPINRVQLSGRRRPTAIGGASLFAARMLEDWTALQATCQIYMLDGTNDPIYFEDNEVCDSLTIFGALGEDDWMIVGLNPDGRYYAIAAGCPGTSPLIASPPESQPSPP
jgi:hypothetical protein